MFRKSLAGCCLALLTLAPGASGGDEKPIVLFSGTSADGLKGWKAKDKKKSAWLDARVQLDKTTPEKLAIAGVGRTGNALINLIAKDKPSSDIYTERTFGDVLLQGEFMVPKGSNSGIYLMGEYEVQILDSYGKADDKLNQGDLGALYSAAAPKKNAAKKPGEWQTFVIDFKAPRFDGAKKVSNAKFVKVTLNGIVLHENVEMKGPTPGGLTGKEHPTGPLMFQGDHGPVAFQHITITPRK
ncbi:MAG: DUF1080 domain-containing protein [Gemmataceae bacterium]